MAVMKLQTLQRHWNRFAKQDAKWAILTCPGTEGNRWDPDAFMATGREDVDALMRALAERGIDVSRRRALDFGCGVGRLSVALANYFDAVDGTDISETMIAQAIQHPKVRYHVNNQSLAQFPTGAYDLVYSFITLQHIPRPYSLEYIKEFVRLLSPHGVAAFQVPSAVNNRRERWRQRLPFLAAAIGYARRGIWANMQRHALTREEVAAVVAAAGGKIVAEQGGFGNAELPSSFYYVTR